MICVQYCTAAFKKGSRIEVNSWNKSTASAAKGIYHRNVINVIDLHLRIIPYECSSL